MVIKYFVIVSILLTGLMNASTGFAVANYMWTNLLPIILLWAYASGYDTRIIGIHVRDIVITDIALYVKA